MRRPTSNYERVPVNEHSDERDSDSDFVEFVSPTDKKSKDYWKKTQNFLPDQFKKLKESPVPWKAIAYACLLFVVGTVLLLCGCLIHVGHIDNNVSWQLN